MLNNASVFNVLNRKVIAASLALSLATAPLLSYMPSSSYASTTAQQPTIQLVDEQPVTAGAVLKKYVWSSTRSNTKVTANANVLVIDLHNPHVKLDVMTGINGTFTTRQTVRGMAQETGAVAGVNGDFYSLTAEGAPIGAQITNGQLMSSPSYLSGMYAFALTKENKPIIDTFTFNGAVTAVNGQSFPLAGVNKTYYWKEPDSMHSHHNALHMYTSAWGSASRANDGSTVPTEVLVQNNVIIEIADKRMLNRVPPQDGYILRASGTAAEFVMNHLKVGDIISSSYQLVPIDPAKTYDTANFKMMIGGHTILVDNGKAAAFSRNVSSLAGFRARTGLGYSQDGRYVYLITVDFNGDSKGMSLSEFQAFMVQIGVWKGLNLDGGGSTQMVARPLGDTAAVLANATETAHARQVVNGLGVYTLAPAGKLGGLLVSGQDTLFINEKSSFQLKAYDEYYNPLSTGDMQVTWTTSSNTGTFQDSIFTALKPGTATIIAASDGVQQKHEVQIIGRKQISSMQFDSEDFVVSAGASYELPVVVVTTNGVKRTIPGELLQWEFRGFSGTVQGNTVHVTSIENGGVARIIARYDGFGTMLTKAAGVQRIFADFDLVSYPVQMQVTPAEVTGMARLVTGLNHEQPNNVSLMFDYNFRQGTGTKAIYAAFNNGAGAAIEGRPSMMSMNVMGDASLNWLRAEFVDANNKSHLVDVANPVDWYGWEKVAVDLEKYKMAFPVQLKRIYVVNPENGQNEREAFGMMAVDDIQFQYKSEVPVTPKAKVEMAINRATITVNGQTLRLDQAPVIRNQTTMIPVRFFVEAMGGEVLWENSTQRATIIRDGHLIEMWIKDAEVIIDGKRVVSPEAPILMNGRTMVPLRLVSEALGWKVGWDQKTYSVTLE